MKKVKKLLAMIMAMTMVFGMAMTVSAAPDEDPTASNIIVEGLAAEDTNTTVNLYAVITWSETDSKWLVAPWAVNYIDTSSNPYEISNESGLVASVSGAPTRQLNLVAGDTSVVFEDVPVGAYVITASGTSAVYSPMVAETYNENAQYMEAEEEIVVAKTSGYTLTKEQKIEADGNVFVGRGEIVTFEITTTFPSFEDPDAEDNTFKIIDTPVGLKIQNVSNISIGGAPQTPVIQGSYDENETEYTIDLSSLIGNENANAGKRVVVTYTAMVTSDEGYSNTANSSRNDVNLGEGDSEEGYTGSLSLTKYNEDSSKALAGAVFELYHNTKTNVEAEGSEDKPLHFVKVNDGSYKKALSEQEENATTQLEVSSEGTLTVTGLDEGHYWFKEIKAPKGYTINTDGVPAEIALTEEWEQNKADINISGLTLTDTKLASLPSTGGIGTTIFTIGGCAIMIAAAALYFASKRKSEEN